MASVILKHSAEEVDRSIDVTDLIGEQTARSIGENWDDISSNVSKHEGDITALQYDVARIEIDITNIKNDITTIKSDIAAMQASIRDINDQIKLIGLKIE